MFILAIHLHSMMFIEKSTFITNFIRHIQGVKKVRRHYLSGHYFFITELKTLKVSEETNNHFSVRIGKLRISLSANIFTRRLNTSPLATGKITVQDTFFKRLWC